jgi:hypothetical protein
MAFVRTDVSEELVAFIIRVTKICELQILTSNRSTLRTVFPLLVIATVVPSSPILVTLMMEAICYSESVLTRVTRRNVSEVGILHAVIDGVRFRPSVCLPLSRTVIVSFLCYWKGRILFEDGAGQWSEYFVFQVKKVKRNVCKYPIIPQM